MKKFDKRNLKTGMLVRTRDRKLRLMLGETAISLDVHGGGLGMHRLDDSLKCPDGKLDDIMEIYNEPIHQGAKSCLAAGMDFWMKEDNFLRHTEMIWKREE